MTGNLGDNHPVLITPEEALDKIGFITIESVERGLAIGAEWKARHAFGDRNESWRGWMYGIIYEAGRIQGIREERLERKPRSGREEERTAPAGNAPASITPETERLLQDFRDASEEVREAAAIMLRHSAERNTGRAKGTSVTHDAPNREQKRAVRSSLCAR